VPIPAKVLDEAHAPLEQRILSFLLASPDQAFTEMEIFVESIPGQNERLAVRLGMLFWTEEEWARALMPLRKALAGLKHDGRVRSGELAGQAYWTASPPKVP